MEAIDEIVAEFLVESHENLDQLDRDLLALEQNPNSRDLLASVFRTIHTIKGTSGFLAFHRLEKLTHVGESLLSKLRDGHIALTDDRATALLKMVDSVRGLLQAIEQSGTEGDGDDSELIAVLSSLREDAPAAAPAPVAEPAPEAATEPAAEVVAEPAAQPAGDPAAEVAAEPAADVAAEPAGEPAPAPAPKRTTKRRAPAASEAAGPAAAAPAPAAPIGEVLVHAGATTPDAVEIARMEQSLGDQRPLGSILVDHGSTTPAAVETALETQDARRSVVDSSIRVDVELLDSLMRLVGELVLARNQLVSRLDEAEGRLEDSSRPARRSVSA